MILPRWTREPLVHFLLAGAALFAFFAWKGEPADPASRTIHVTREDRARLALQWQRTMLRPPTDAELDALTETWLREEILYREALRLGLDRDDAIVRKRLASKMDFLAESMAESEQPDEATLQKWLSQHPQNFAADTAYSFDQLYFITEAAARDAQQALRKGADWRALGEPIELPRSRENTGTDVLRQQFGIQFAGDLAALKPGPDWAGPLPSGYGWHLVRLRARTVGTVPPLSAIRERVENDWRNATLEARREAAYQLLRGAYRITIDK